MSEAEVVGTQETEQAVGLDAILSKNLEGYGEDTPAVKEVEAAVEKTADELKLDATGRAHAADGKFAAKKSAEEPAPTGQADTSAAIPAAQTQADTAPKVQQVELPEAWSAEWKAKAATLPPDQQQLLVEQYKAMQGDYTRKTQATAETQRQIEPIIGEVQKLNPLLTHMGMTPQQFIAESGAVAGNLLSGNPKNRADAIAYLVQHRQVPIPELLSALGVSVSPDGQGVRPPDPAISQLHQTVSTLQTQLRQQQEHQANQERQRAQAEFSALGQAKDNDGQAKFPHFQRVSQTMLQLVASGQSDTWDNAYSKAVRLDDELYKQTVETERQRVSVEAEKQRLEAVEKAKKAQPVKSSDGSPSGAAKLKGLDAHISGALERSGFGA